MAKRLGLIFPGYGEQFIGMGKDLYDEFRVIQEFFEDASSSVDTNFVHLLFASSDEKILSLKYSYLSIYLFESALYELLWQKGLRPDFLAGYGIGEYAAAFASRSLLFTDGLYILNKYSQFYEQFIQGKDFTVLRIVRGFTVETLQELINTSSNDDQRAFISAKNSSSCFYVAGHKKVIQKVEKYCKEQVIRKVKDIGPEYGLHSEFLDGTVDHLKMYYHKIEFKPLKTPVITNVDAVYVTAPEALQSAIMRRINNPVLWDEVMQGLGGCDVILSIGPGKQLLEWFQELYPDKEYHQVSELKDLDAISEYLTDNKKTDEAVEAIVADDGEKVGELRDSCNLVDADTINDRNDEDDD